MKAYLDDLPTHPKSRFDHLAHLRAIFLRCRFYHICLNLYECVFFVEPSHLLGFIVSKHGIQFDFTKVKTILKFPPPQSILQLQCLEGKGNFLRNFVINYVEITKGFVHVLKKGVPFLWDD